MEEGVDRMGNNRKAFVLGMARSGYEAANYWLVKAMMLSSMTLTLNKM